MESELNGISEIFRHSFSKSWNYYSNVASPWSYSTSYTTPSTYSVIVCLCSVNGIYNPMGVITGNGKSKSGCLIMTNISSGTQINFGFSVAREQANSDQPYTMNVIILAK